MGHDIMGTRLWLFTPKIDRATWAFLKFDVPYRAYGYAAFQAKNVVTCDVVNKRQRQATLPFLKIDM